MSNTFVESVSNVLQRRSNSHSFDVDSSGSCINNKYKANSLSESNDVASLCSIRQRNLNKTVVAPLSLNPLRIKFESLVQKTTGNVNILMISETKLDNSFPEGHLLI